VRLGYLSCAVAACAADTTPIVAASNRIRVFIGSSWNMGPGICVPVAVLD